MPSTTPLSRVAFGVGLALALLVSLAGPIWADNVDQLIALLKSDDPQERAEAAQGLVRLRDGRAVEPLIAALEDKVSLVRRAAARALGKLQDARALEPLTRALKDKQHRVREAVVSALADLGDERAVESLILALDDELLRLQVVQVLVRLGDERVVEPLIRCLGDAEELVRYFAAQGLGRLNAPRAVAPLLPLLEDRRQEPRGAAAKALTALGWKPTNKRERASYLIALGRWRDIPALGSSAVDPLVRSLESDQRGAAAAALEKLGWRPQSERDKALYFVARGRWDDAARLGAVAVEPIVRTVKPVVEESHPGDRPTPTQKRHGRSLEALAAIGRPAVDALAALLEHDDQELCATAAYVVGKLGEKRAVQPLINAIDDERGHVRAWAALALGQLGERRALEPLVEKLTDPHPQVRCGAATALGELGDRRALEPLRRALEDDEPEVKGSAATALRQLGDPPARGFVRLLQNEVDPRVRHDAAATLGELGDPIAIGPLVAALEDRHPYVRKRVALALAKLGWKPATKRERAWWLAAQGKLEETAKLGTVAEEPLRLALRAHCQDDLAATLAKRGASGDATFMDTLRLMRMVSTERHGKKPGLRDVEKVMKGFEAREAREKEKRRIELLALLQALEYKDPLKRRDAISRIGQSPGPERIVPLTAALRDEDSRVRHAAARALSNCRESRALEPLIQALEDEDKLVRHWAAIGLGNLGDARAVEPLMAAARDREPLASRTAVEALGKIGDARAASAVADALASRDLGVRHAALQALGKLGTDAALEPLLAAAGDKRLGLQAILALGELRDPRAIGPLLKLAERGKFIGSTAIVEALAKVGPAAVEPLLAALEHPAWGVRWVAAAALGKLKDARASEPLRTALDDKHEMVRQAAATALSELGEPGTPGGARAVDRLRAALRDPSGMVRHRAATSLRRLGWKPQTNVERAEFLVASHSWHVVHELGDAAVAPLVVAMRDPAHYIRLEAAKALAKIRPAGLEPLIAGVADEQPGVREAAASALAGLGDPRSIEPLVELLKKGDMQVRFRVAKALHAAGAVAGKAIPALTEVSSNKKNSSSVRKAAAEALEAIRGELGDLQSYASIEAAIERARWQILLREKAPGLYFRGTRDPSPAREWTAVTFYGEGWEAGTSGFGYSDGDDTTVLGDMQNSYTTLYVRHYFQVADPRAFETLKLIVRSDDGCVAYLNGTEVGRIRAGAPGVSLDFDAVAAHKAPEPLKPVEISVEPWHLRQRGNVLALQGLNHSKGSSDFSLSATLAGAVYPGANCIRKRCEELRAAARGAGLDHARAYIEGRLLQLEGKHKQAADKFTALLTSAKAAAEPHVRLAESWRALKKPKHAEKHLRSVLSTLGDPGELCDLWWVLAAVDLKRGAREILALLPDGTAPGLPRPVADLRWTVGQLVHEGAVRLDCGGTEHRDRSGRLWGRDRFLFSGRISPRQDRSIEATKNDEIYRTEVSFYVEQRPPRGYRIPLPVGNYRVTLHFAEIFFRTAGKRRFDVLLEGKTVLDDYEPKIDKASSVSFKRRISDGYLDLEFVHVRDNPQVSAIEIEALGN